MVVAPSYFNEIGVLRLEQNGPPPSVPCASTQRSTKADHFMMLCYCVNVLVWAAVISQYVMYGSKEDP